MKITLAINATPLVGHRTGVAKYIEHLMREVEKHEEFEPNYFLWVAWTKTLQMPSIQTMANASKIKLWAKKIVPKAELASAIFRKIKFVRGIRRFKIDLYHEPNFIPYRFAGPTIITVHDLSWLRYPETHPADRVRAMERNLPKAIERSRFVLVDSEFVRQEVIELMGVRPQKVVTTKLGVSSEHVPRTEFETQNSLSAFRLNHKKYILSVGTLEPRKNLVQLFLAYKGLPEKTRSQFPLVVAGLKGWGDDDGLMEDMEPLLAKGQIRLLGYVPDPILPILYSGATTLVYPSMYEGFGLPPLEAMASGTPVITSDRASLPEVVGEAGIKLDPHDVDGMKDAIMGLIESPLDRDRRIAAGIERAKSFTWERCAAETVAVYKRAVQ